MEEYTKSSVIKIGNSYPLYENIIEFPNTLVEHDNFVHILDSAGFYRPVLIGLLKDKEQTLNTKWVALYTLQKLCIEDYIEVIEVVYQEYKKKNLDNEFLFSALGQDDFSVEVRKKYRYAPLNQLLDTLSKDMSIPNATRRFIIDIKSGESWWHAVDYYGSMGGGYPWSCD